MHMGKNFLDGELDAKAKMLEIIINIKIYNVMIQVYQNHSAD